MYIHLVHASAKKTQCGIPLAHSPEPIYSVTLTNWERVTCPDCKGSAIVRELGGDRNPRRAGAKPLYGEKLQTLNTKPSLPASRVSEFEQKSAAYGGKAKFLRDALLEKMDSME